MTSQLLCRSYAHCDSHGPAGEPELLSICKPENIFVPNYYRLSAPAPFSLDTTAIRKLQALGNSNSQLANHQPLLPNLLQPLRPCNWHMRPLVCFWMSFMPSRCNFSFLSELALMGSLHGQSSFLIVVGHDQMQLTLTRSATSWHAGICCCDLLPSC